MTEISRERWAVIARHLDAALDLPAGERAAWLASIAAQDEALAADLRRMLDEHEALERERFLEDELTAIRPDGPSPLAGTVLGAYTLFSEIGRGGMGTVWLARRTDGRFEGTAAIKLLNIALVGRAGEERFTREGNILASLTHPNIAHLVDAGVSATGQPYLVLEHVDGERIDRYCDARALDVEARLRLVLDVLDAVAHAHANLIVHRDIKPSNVLVRTDGRVKLLDFGIAKLLQPEAEPAPTVLTGEGATALTPEYAAPEQVTGGAITTATDVYALGVLIYVLLAGQHPAGEGLRSAADLVRSIVDRDPPPPSDVVTSPNTSVEVRAAAAVNRATTPDRLRLTLRGDLDTIVAKALKKDPAERYASVTALADDLRRYLRHEPISARPDTLRYRASRFVRRNRTAVALASIALLATIAGAVGTLVYAHSARAQRDFALRQLARADAINDLNTFVLMDAAPAGSTFTVNELLARARHIVERQHGEDEATRVNTLIAIGRQYWAQDEDAEAIEVLTEAHRLAQTLDDASMRARAQCALASALARTDAIRRAEPMVQAGLAVLPTTPEYLADRIFCLKCGTEIAQNRGAGDEAVARAEQALDLLRSAPFSSDIMELRLRMDVAESYRVAGNFPKAAAAFERAAGLLKALGRDDTQTAGTLFNNWALTLDLMGRPRDAEPIYRRGIEVSKADATERAVSPMLLLNYARVLENLGRPNEASDYAVRAYRKAAASHDEVIVTQALLMRNTIDRVRGDLAQSTADLDEVEPILRKKFPTDHPAIFAIVSGRALLAAARGDERGAMQLADQAVASLERTSPGSQRLALSLRLRADIELQFGRLDAAEADARKALDLLERATPPGLLTARVGKTALTLGRALAGQHRSAEARRALTLALTHLRDADGPDHPDVRQAASLLSSLQ
ncbi:MAG TPA: protein kinase [Vicinamibacterales bacterium]|nr:protein kinase [Vicinamibacterales bacterium]